MTDAAGYAEIALPSWFEAANRDFRYQLTVVDEGDHPGFVQAKVVRRIAGGRFSVRTSAPHVEVCWLVTGIRRDRYAERHPIVTELDKSFRIHRELGTHLGGVHFELTGEDVTECIGGARGLVEGDLARAYRTQVDPRLNYEQALELAMRIATNARSG